MRKLLCFLLLIPVHLFAQENPQRSILDVAQSYRIALIEFARTNPDAVINTSEGRTMFVKAKDFTKSLPDTAGDLHIKFIDPETDGAAAIAAILKKKQKHMMILDMQQMLLRDLDMEIWIMPMRTSFNPKKQTLSTPEYDTRGCKFIFDYGTSRTVYLYKESQCKELE